MCTVSFIPAGKRVYITSNRDEKHFRLPALPPQLYSHNGHALVFPKDGDAGGTWIAINKNGSVVILLNGGFVFHESNPPYKRSRGLVLLDIIASDQLLLSYQQIDLEGIEPFTCILWDGHQLHECRWDGVKKHITQKPADIPHIWSSATLYINEVIEKRKQWFSQWLQHAEPSLHASFELHRFGGEGDAHNDFFMNRNGLVYTVSITAIEMDESQAVMHYHDLQDDTTFDQTILFNKASVSP